MTTDGQDKAGPDDWTDADQRWFDALTGKLDGQPADDDADAQEGQLMRQAFQAQDAAIRQSESFKAMTSEAATEAGLAQLMSELRAQGHFGQEAAKPASPAPIAWWQGLLGSRGTGAGDAAALRWRGPLGWAAVAAVLAVLVTPFWLQQPDYGEPPETVLRGEEQTIARTDANPKQAAESLASRLKAAGVVAQVYQHRQTYIVVITVVERHLPAAADALRGAGLPDRVGDYRVEFNRR